MNLLIVGVVAFDQVETPFGKSGKMMGGPGLYSAIAASYFPITVSVVSKVGYDFKANQFDVLKKRNIDFSQLEQSMTEKTFFWHGRYHNDMNSRDTLATDLNVYQSYRPVLKEACEPDVLLLANDHPKNQLSIINQLPKRPKLIVMDTMNYWMDNTWEDLMDTIKEIDVLTINDSEARQLSGEYSLVKAARKIMDMGPKFLIIKKGEHGALLFNGEEIFFAPALPLEDVFDPTGAGDSFAGGFCGYLATTNDFSFENMKKAIVQGSALASFCIEKFGAERIQEISEKDLVKRIEAFKQLVQL